MKSIYKKTNAKITKTKKQMQKITKTKKQMQKITKTNAKMINKKNKENKKDEFHKIRND
jgi:uncharacterized membrane protein